MTNNVSLDHILSMAHSHVRNYVIPGLTSSLIGTPGPQGTLRLFQCSREHQEVITPHSHRFDLACLVLEGWVKNRLWTKTSAVGDGDEYQTIHLEYCGEIGQYQKHHGEVTRWEFNDYSFDKGEWYFMQADEVHSIHFSRGCAVLLFEGPQISSTSICIEPFVDGEVVETMDVKPWMFKRDAT